MKQSGLVFMGLGFELAAVFVAGAWIGSTVDEYMGWKSLGLLSITGALFIAWVTHFVYLIKRFMKNTDESKH
jgi:hypothetical protein